MPASAAKIDYASLDSRDLVWLAQVEVNGYIIASLSAQLAEYEKCTRTRQTKLASKLTTARISQQASVELLNRKEEVMRRLVRNCVKRYSFVDPDDLYQSLVLSFFRIIQAYRPGKNKNGWDKYCYHKLVFAIKDILRQRDDLGIKWPQKKHYPKWFHLYDKSDSSESGNVYANSIDDYRQLSQESADDLEFHESIEDLRKALPLCLSRPTVEAAGPVKHQSHPQAWTVYVTDSGRLKQKYYWPAEPQPKRKRGESARLNLIQWHRERMKPKQMVMW